MNAFKHTYCYPQSKGDGFSATIASGSLDLVEYKQGTHNYIKLGDGSMIVGVSCSMPKVMVAVPRSSR